MRQLTMEGDAPKKRGVSTKSGKGNVSQSKQGDRRLIEEHVTVRIVQRAHEIYLQRMSRGPLDDWLEAEREILSHEPPA